MTFKNKNKSILILGATGAVGHEVLKELLANYTNFNIYVLVRKKINLDATNLNQIIVNNFHEPINELNNLNIDHLIISFGTTIKKAGSQKKFREVDYIIPKKIIDSVFHKKISISLVSSYGVKENTRNFYLSVKKELEDYCFLIGPRCLLIYRPSILDAKRKEFRISESIGILIGNQLIKYIPYLSKYRPMNIKTLAKAICYHLEKRECNKIYELQQIEESLNAK